ncbi:MULTISPECIES: LysR family transcriptional regulator [unclassified Massilia]|uniref:LysR family transcriptional regulator n=1 Tax=unclassified Massilia TaxID=2609279 RepID=UPI00178030DA|nr:MULTISPECIES: LysR family transcriptional regulator [unclassified Massilia]MBD8533092.1 LysR family transcriptional regulator [Massilia sp. CFBP 13647]MBD8676551.1 LysR family transcriptional regulator [Massilia sp. CFBP 13721]
MRSQISEEITFRKLEVLIAFMEGGSLNGAAELLGISVVSVHRALHSLEESLACQLFGHKGRNLIPTQAARELADASREVIKLMGDAVAAARETAGYSSGHLKIGSLYSLTNSTAPDVIFDIKLRRPELQTELVLGSNADLLHKLKHNAIDAALMAVPELDPDIVSIPLFDDDIFFAAPAGSPYAHEAAIDLRACAGEKYVSLSEGFVTYHGFVEAFRVAGFAPSVVMQVSDIFSLMNLVSAGLGYTLLPGRVRDVFGDKLQLIPLKPEYRMRQTIGVNFLRVRERDPNLLALAAACRMLRHGKDGAGGSLAA